METRIAVNSSVIAAVRYSRTATLDVEFTSGRAYRYFAVPERVLQDFLSSDSKGEFFSRNIRSAFPCERLGA